MLPIPKSQVLGITDLQKISARRLRKLQKSGAPLLVMDKKSGREIFVILDWENYRRIQDAVVPGQAARALKAPVKIALKDFDFAACGLFWDRRGMTNGDFVGRLTNPAHAEHVWAVTRLFERLKSPSVLRLFGWDGARDLLQKARLRPAFREPWQNAFAYREKRLNRE